MTANNAHAPIASSPDTDDLAFPRCTIALLAGAKRAAGIPT
jgi:hypothetical protein